MSNSRNNASVWRQARTLSALFWTGFGSAPLAALLLLVGSSDFTIKAALILGLGSVVLIGLSVALRTDITEVERDLQDSIADVEAETRRALKELRGEVRRATAGHEAPKAVGSAPRPPRELPYEADDPRRARQAPQGQGEYPARHVSPPREDERYVAETTAVPRQRWEDEYPANGDNRDRRSGRRGQAVESWRADDQAADYRSARRSRGVENGWSEDPYNSGSQPRARADSGGRGRRYREDDNDSDEIPTRSGRRREYASGQTRPRNGSSYMDQYYGENRR